MLPMYVCVCVYVCCNLFLHGIESTSPDGRNASSFCFCSSDQRVVGLPPEYTERDVGIQTDRPTSDTATIGPQTLLLVGVIKAASISMVPVSVSVPVSMIVILAQVIIVAEYSDARQGKPSQAQTVDQTENKQTNDRG